MLYLLIPFYGLLNRARGTKIWTLTSSTIIGRVVSMGLIALSNTCVCWKLKQISGVSLAIEGLGSLVLLLLWCTSAWDALWGQTMDTTKPVTGSRLNGLFKFTIRMALILPYMALQRYMGFGLSDIAFSDLWALLWLTMAFWYYLSGKIINPTGTLQPGYWADRIVAVPELFCGGTIALATIKLLGL